MSIPSPTPASGSAAWWDLGFADSASLEEVNKEKSVSRPIKACVFCLSLRVAPAIPF